MATGTTQPMQPTQPAQQLPPDHWLKPIHLWFVAIVLVVAAAVGGFYTVTEANADYICTQTVTTTGGCSNGSWGAWTTASPGVEERTYTGTRAISTTLSYLNLRTQCQAGYTQQASGSGDGESGNQGRGGDITTQYSACQLVQTRTTGAAPSGSGSTVTLHTAASTTTGPVQTTTTHVGTVADLDAAGGGAGSVGEALTDAQATLEVKPQLVRSGDSATVTWNATGVTTCSVTANNGDAWNGAISGSHPTSPILGKTTYSLTCPLTDGTSLNATADVSVIPSFQEQ